MPNKAGFSAGVRGGRKSSPLAPSPLAPGLCPWHCPSVPSPPLLGKPVAGREPLPSGQLLTWGVAGPQAQPWLCPVPRILTSPLCSFSCVLPNTPWPGLRAVPGLCQACSYRRAFAPAVFLSAMYSPRCRHCAPTSLECPLRCEATGSALPSSAPAVFPAAPSLPTCLQEHRVLVHSGMPAAGGQGPSTTAGPWRGRGRGDALHKRRGALSSERAPEPQGRTASGGRWSQVWAGLTSR